MDKQYRALKPIGRWAVGETIGDLPDLQINQLQKDGAIEEMKESQNLKSEIKPTQKKVNSGDNSNG
ncbi:hypothetical protein [Acinetobacter junii]|jgi:hypothetical protein|uniref:Uncharacterized protein n=1 Tax=Acinetobacter junii TaxID=40215 RepID=A0AAW5RE80_ACIJU|nr:hypothetical protein [Acinetobacter junii]MCU4397365.1 hypothetical protein [Acinetobacter junii]MDA3509312.1 hypothetical protein [Acinetobacter junii]MDA3533611.1 hypothetical protein [Acinetobacter junii]MDR7655497.1 hypothetical protein [Acinetobacter junii]RTE46589.1 hypothetical protein EJJ36_05280 [Acinetobacter junii]